MEQTEIFEDFGAFKERKNKDLNGVSVEFAEKYPDYKEMNSTNKGCWDCAYSMYCDTCMQCFYSVELTMCIQCAYCKNCNFCAHYRNRIGVTKEHLRR